MDGKLKLILSLFLLLCTSFGIRATHVLNYTYEFRVIDHTATQNKVEIEVRVLNDCISGSPMSISSDLMLGIYGNTGGAKVAELQLAYIKTDALPDLSDTVVNGCFSVSTFRASAWLQRDYGTGYALQINTCCYGILFNNLYQFGSSGVFHEFHIPSGIDSGFHSVHSSPLALYFPQAHASTWIHFSEVKGSFDSVRYQLAPVYLDPDAQFKPIGYVSPSRVIPQTIPYKPGFSKDNPLGTGLQHILIDTGSLFIARPMQQGVFQVGIKVNSYLNGTAYSGIRYLTLVPDPRNLPRIGLKGKTVADGAVQLDFRFYSFSNFQEARLFRYFSGGSALQDIAGLLMSDTLYTDNGLIPDSSYTYFIRGINGVDTFFSPTITIKAKFLDPDITLSGVLDGGRISLSWTTRDIPQGSYFVIMRGIDSNQLTQILLTPNQTYKEYPPQVKQTYYYQIHWRSGDTIKSNLVSIYYPDPNGLNDPAGPEILLFPNPATSQLTIQSPASMPFELYFINGQKQLEGLLSEGENILNIDSMPAGIYFLKTEFETVKIVVNRAV